MTISTEGLSSVRPGAQCARCIAKASAGPAGLSAGGNHQQIWADVQEQEFDRASACVRRFLFGAGLQTDRLPETCSAKFQQYTRMSHSGHSGAERGVTCTQADVPPGRPFRKRRHSSARWGGGAGTRARPENGKTDRGSGLHGIWTENQNGMLCFAMRLSPSAMG